MSEQTEFTDREYEGYMEAMVVNGDFYSFNVSKTSNSTEITFLDRPEIDGIPSINTIRNVLKAWCLKLKDDGLVNINFNSYGLDGVKTNFEACFSFGYITVHCNYELMPAEEPGAHKLVMLYDIYGVEPETINLLSYIAARVAVHFMENIDEDNDDGAIDYV